MITITSQRAVEREIYSASMVLRAVRDWILDFYEIGNPTYRITNPVREREDRGSRDELYVQDLT